MALPSVSSKGLMLTLSKSSTPHIRLAGKDSFGPFVHNMTRNS